jgi:hypothetical protein
MSIDVEIEQPSHGSAVAAAHKQLRCKEAASQQAYSHSDAATWFSRAFIVRNKGGATHLQLLQERRFYATIAAGQRRRWAVGRIAVLRITDGRTAISQTQTHDLTA